jgi:hypothetical protein
MALEAMLDIEPFTVVRITVDRLPAERNFLGV